jgi:hypothetical protein
LEAGSLSGIWADGGSGLLVGSAVLGDASTALFSSAALGPPTYNFDKESLADRAHEPKGAFRQSREPAVPLLTPTFQIDLRKFCSGWDGLRVQQIHDMFHGAGIELGPENAAISGGDRQKLAQRYLSTINWDSEEDVEKVLQAVTITLFGDETSPEHKEKLRALCEKEGLHITNSEVVLPGDAGRKKKASPSSRRSSVAEFEIFVSWSRPGSRQAAEAFKEWLPEALPGAKPWMSKEDISKGRPWFASVSEQLSRSKACLV